MTIDDGQQSEQPGTPRENPDGADEVAGASPMGPAPDAATNEPPVWSSAPEGGSPNQPGTPPVPPATPQGWAPAPSTPQGWPPAPTTPTGWPQAPSGSQGWPPAPPASWPPSQQSGWPAAQPGWSQGPGAPQSWPPAPQSWPPAQPAWPPVPQPAWPPVPQPAWPPVPTQPVAGPFVADEWVRSQLEAQRRRPNRLPLILSFVAAIAIAFGSGVAIDRAVAPPQASSAAPLKDFAVYEQALQDIRNNYVGRNSVTDQQLLYGSISGMVDSLGDTGHSRFLTPQEYQQMTSQLSGKIAGIGILVTQDNGLLKVDRVIAGSPAEAAGVLAGDQITAVNGTSTVGMTFDQMASLIRGDVGTKVIVSVIHPGATTSVDISMTRAVVSAPLVSWGMVPGTHVAEVALFEFSTGAGDQVRQAIKAAKLQGASSIVFDLRGNPGGIADEARSVASDFLASGTVYLTEDASGHQTKVAVDASIASTDLPTVVLIDHNSASAAEIVAGALQDNHRAKLVGQTTFGTGTVLEPFVLSDGSVVLLGVADWLTPDGHRIFGKGITPDESVTLPTGGQPLDPTTFGKMTVAQLQASSDSQLMAALKDLGS